MKNIQYKTGIFFWSFFLTFLPALGQKLQLQGKVFDQQTQEPLPFVSLKFKDTTIGTITNADGYYTLSANVPVSALEVSFVGYERKTIDLTGFPGYQLDIPLKEEVFAINEITVTPGENPAHKMLRQIIARKDVNDPERFPDWKSRVYNKIEIDLKNVKKPEKNSKLWKQLDFIFDYVDTLDADGKTFLPAFITETLSDYYHVQDGTGFEKIIANKISGMQTSMISEFTGKLYADINPYNNFIMLADVGMISPLNNQGLTYYHYYLRDSTIVDGQKIYELSFFPKYPQEPLFRGKFWVADSTFALTRIGMRLSSGANVNFLRDLAFEKEYVVRDNFRVPGQESLWIDFNLQKKNNGKLIGLLGRKSTTYTDFRFSAVPGQIKGQKKAVTVLPDALAHNEQYWDSIRPVGLQARESAIYEMVDSLKNVPVVKTTFDYIQMFFFGYKDVGKFEIGPYYYMYSFNEIEGNRFRFGGRTTDEFNSRLRLNGYMAYGLRDQDIKYSAGAEYFFRKDPRFSLGVQYMHDYRLLGRSDNAFMEDNVLMVIVSKHPLTKLNMNDQFTFRIDKEWKGAFSNSLVFSASEIHSGPYVAFTDVNHNPVRSIRNSELSLNTRIAPGERTISGKFEKISLGSPNPIVNVRVATGLKGMLNGDYNYLKLHFDLYDKLPLNPVGYTSYFIQAGRIWGDVPFPLLKIHEGNETYTFDSQAFNLMNYQEFVSDRYAGIFLEQHFQGFFFNKIPVFRKLKWREVAGVRWLAGDISKSEHDQLTFPRGMSSLRGTSYAEASAGIENILRLIRVDAVWRLTGSDFPYDRFSLLFSLQFTL